MAFVGIHAPVRLVRVAITTHVNSKCMIMEKVRAGRWDSGSGGSFIWISKWF